MAERARTDRLGVSKVDHFFSSQGWLFREQPIHDYGIDAHVEIVRDGEPTGNLIGLQIKSGKSFFSEEKEKEIIYRADDMHIQYWLEHSLPVVIVLYHPERDTCYWEQVSDETTVSTGKGWKIAIPKSNELADATLEHFESLTQPPLYIQKLNKLRLDQNWIKLVAAGETVFVEYEDWVNKSLPRFQITIGCDSRDDIDEEIWPTTYGASVEELITSILPWADLEMDWDAHESFMEMIWADECYRGHDGDGMPYHSEPFDTWYRQPEGITHISENGETQGYRLLISLNEIGRAFVDLDEYLSANDPLVPPGFTLD